jgi:hypothetical protein
MLCIVANFSVAQKITIQGFLKDSANQPLPSATVLLLNPADSSLINFAPSDSEGKFVFKNVNRQSFLLKVSYVGFSPYLQKIDPDTSHEIVELGILHLREESKQLKELVVEAEKTPVVIKNDTVEFNAPSFKVNENAMVEDLLKKLPGVEVDNDGTIRAQGKEVERVTVDGKTFFGNDPKVATRNLPADAVSKVQVFDKKSDQATFTGIDDGQREKTINLELKEEKRKGAFGNISLGAGDDRRYQAKASVNQFRKGKQLSFLGMANNINEQGFGIDEYMNFSGGSQSMISGRSDVRIELNDENQNGVPLNFGNRIYGVMNSSAGGLNFNKGLNKKTEIGTSYFYNHLDHDMRGSLLRENYFPDVKLDYSQNSVNNSINDNHKLNFLLDHKVDSMNSVKFNTSATFNQTDASENGHTKLIDGSGLLINSSDRATVALGRTARLTSALLWRHKFSKKGRTLSTNFQHNISEDERSGSLDAWTKIRDNEAGHLMQKNDQEIVNKSYAATVSYTEPLGRRKYLEGNYSWRINQNSFLRNVYDVLENELVKVEDISTEYSSEYQFQRAGLNFKINRRNYNVTVGSSIQNAKLVGILKTSDVRISKTFINVLPVARFNYSFSNEKNLEFDYETNVQEPSIRQLQPVTENSDPLNLYVGNPDLRPAYAQNWRLNYMAFNPVSFVNFFSFIEATYTTDAIVISQSIDTEGIRTSKPVNVRNNKILQGNISMGFPIKQISSRIGLSSNFSRQSGITVIDDVQGKTLQKTISGRVRYDFRYQEIFDIGLTATISRQTAEFGISENDQQYYNNSFTAESNLTFLKNYVVSTSLEYLDYRNRTNGFNQGVPLLDVSVSRFLLKGKAGELRASVKNLLDKSLGVTQTSGLNYFERTEMNSLGRYFLLSFVYSLNKQLNPLATRPRGGMIRIMR